MLSSFAIAMGQVCIVYAALAWSRRSRPEDAVVEPDDASAEQRECTLKRDREDASTSL